MVCFLFALCLLLAPHRFLANDTAGVAEDRCPSQASGSQPCGGEAEPTSLLQGSRRQAPRFQSHRRQCKRAIAFEGGGYKAQAVAAANIAAMLNALGGDEHGGMDKLFENIDIVSSNSGGSWFAASALYSSSYVDMLRAMGREPERAAEIYAAQFVAKLLQAAPVQGADLAPPCAAALATASSGVATAVDNVGQIIYDVCRKLGRNKLTCNAAKIAGTAFFSKFSWQDIEALLAQTHIPWRQDAMQMAYVVNETGGLSWRDIITATLNKTAGIGVDVTMGSSPNRWAVGKDWLACASIASPSVGSDTSAWYFYGEQVGGEASASYHTTESGFRYYIPARFSVRLGGGEGSSSPYPFCGDELCFNWNFEAEGRNSSDDLSAAGTEPRLSAVRGLESGAGALPVAYVAASSSAALGMTVYQRPLAAVFQSCAPMSTWVSGSAEHGAAYSAADDALWEVSREATQESVARLAREEVQSVVDGAYTDNSGVAWAVGSGATEVVAVLNSVTALADLFSSSQPVEAEPVVQGMPITFHIFNTSRDEVVAQMEAFPTLDLSASNSKFLKNISYGSITATTADNKWFGVRAGRSVVVHILSYEVEDLSMAFFSNYYGYAKLVGEIMGAYARPDNAEATRAILQRFFLSSCMQ